MSAKTKCYDHTQEAISAVKLAVHAKHRQDGVVDEEEAYIEHLLEEAGLSARETATFVRTGIRWLGGGGINSGLLVELRATEREMQIATGGDQVATYERENRAA